MGILIFVTLGTQDKPFNRLLEAIEQQVIRGNLTDEIVIQAGYTNFQTQCNNIKVFDLIDRDLFEDFMNESSLLITHGGVGSIISGLTHGKKVIAVPRLHEYGEHVNNHQLEIIKCFAQKKFILPLYDFKEFDLILDRVRDFTPEQYNSNNSNFNNFIKSLIDD